MFVNLPLPLQRFAALPFGLAGSALILYLDAAEGREIHTSEPPAVASGDYIR